MSASKAPLREPGAFPEIIEALGQLTSDNLLRDTIANTLIADAQDGRSGLYIPNPYKRAEDILSRVRLLQEFGALTINAAAEVAEPYADTLNELRQSGSIFAIDDRATTIFPSFQFDEETGRPLPAIAEILAGLPKELVSDGWQLTRWFYDAQR